jgi:hypothetical protein
VPLRILLCPSCGTRVALTQAGQCPACRGTVADAEPIEDTNHDCIDAAVVDEQPPRLSAVNSPDETSVTPYRPNIDKLRQQERSSHSSGQWLRVLGTFEVVLALIIVFVGSCAFPLNLLLALPFVLAARKSLQQSRQLLMPNAHVLLSADTRPPVLFLRSYQDDGSYGQNPFLESVARVHPLSAVFRRQTYEESLAESTACVGPVVAVGKPGEPLPELGAARMYLPHTHWQATVRELMEKARLVILRLGPTPGLAWELKTAITVVPPENLVLYREPPGNLADDLANLLPVELPSSVSQQRFIFFESNWTPHSARSMTRLLKQKRLYRVQLKTIVLIAAIVVLCAALAFFAASYL